ncbi:hypothetical protein [Bosea sp. Root670]|uniref:hypothetical protein n=1 Tax=Bosea sp. Root670 TaxID=1736583 RepID=UPI0012E3E15E|nr:hypothetical protein [Bosea sp. Root670]
MKLNKFSAVATTLVAILTCGAAYSAPTVTGPAAKAASQYMNSTMIACYRNSIENKCRISDMGMSAKIFYGNSSTGSPLADENMAIVFLDYQYDNTGNAVDQMAIVLKGSNESWKVIGRADNTVGSSPDDVKFSKDTITYMGKYVTGRDSRSNPTGNRRFTLKYTANSVTFVKDMR